MGALQDLTGQKFGRLTVVRRGPNTRQGWVAWDCNCECGKSKTVAARDLRSGNTRSCGCWHDENRKANIATYPENFKKTRIAAMKLAQENRRLKEQLENAKEQIKRLEKKTREMAKEIYALGEELTMRNRRGSDY